MSDAREYHAILTMQWPMFPSGFNCSTVERTFTPAPGETRAEVFRDMREAAADAAVKAGASSAKAGRGTVLVFTCEPNAL